MVLNENKKQGLGEWDPKWVESGSIQRTGPTGIWKKDLLYFLIAY
jgi:hypothetical protein